MHRAHRRAFITTAVALAAALASNVVDAQQSSAGVTGATFPAERHAPASTPVASRPAPRGEDPSTRPPPVRPATRATVSLGGYVEALYNYNFNNPANAVTNFRGFDNRHNTFTLSNVVLDAAWSVDAVSGRIALQVGHTPETYYLAEPDRAGGSGAGASNLNVWKFIQQAYVSWRAPLGRGLTLEAGVFLSPIGVEALAVHDSWNWSRSNLFFGLPFYHTGLRASYPLTDRISVSAAVFNGWNSVTDNNPEKSVVLQFTYAAPGLVALSALYFSGVERAPGAAEGRAWRHLFDAHATVHLARWLSVAAHANAGFEPNDLGISHWAAGALYARVRPLAWLYIAARGDFFYEGVPGTSAGAASPIFWPSRWVSSATATVETRPHEQLSVRVEYRHDEAEGNTYYRGQPAIDPGTGAPTVNARSQDTLTLGATAWF